MVVGGRRRLERWPRMGWRCGVWKKAKLVEREYEYAYECRREDGQVDGRARMTINLGYQAKLARVRSSGIAL